MEFNSKLIDFKNNAGIVKGFTFNSNSFKIGNFYTSESTQICTDHHYTVAWVISWVFENIVLWHTIRRGESQIVKNF